MRTIKTYSKRAPFYNAFVGSSLPTRRHYFRFADKHTKTLESAIMSVMAIYRQSSQCSDTLPRQWMWPSKRMWLFHFVDLASPRGVRCATTDRLPLVIERH